MASVYETLFGFGIFGIITLIIVLFIILVLIAKNIKTIGNFFSGIIFSSINLFESFFKNNQRMIGADNCAIVPGTGLAVTRVPSVYLAHVAFFFGFLFTNAYTIYNLPSQSVSDETYANRKSRTAMIMAILVALYVIIVVLRYNISGCESSLGILLTTTIFGALGYGTYKFAETCGCRPSDVLGISTSFVSNEAKAPTVCAARR